MDIERGKIREQDVPIGDKISKCVSNGSFTTQDMAEILELIKQAGYHTPKQTDREAVTVILGCRFADIIEKRDPHGYELCPEAIDDLADKICFLFHEEVSKI